MTVDTLQNGHCELSEKYCETVYRALIKASDRNSKGGGGCILLPIILLCVKNCHDFVNKTETEDS